MRWLLFMAFAYLVGSIPFGLVVSRLLGGGDPRAVGSGNLGATNVARTQGKKAGALTLLGDALKGFLPTALAVGAFHSPWAIALIGLAAYLGHLFPLYLHFKGGKGVATGLGVFLALAPGSVLWAAAVFGLVLWRGRVVSLGSMAAAGALPLLLAFFGAPLATVALGLVMAGLTVWKHNGNIERILDGSENRWGSTAEPTDSMSGPEQVDG